MSSTNNAFSGSETKVQVPTLVGYEDYQKMVNHYEMKCNLYNQQINEWTNKYAQLQNKYQKLVIVTSDLQTQFMAKKQELAENEKTLTEITDEHKFLQKAYSEAEQKLKKTTRLYRNIIPEHLCEDNIRQSPTRKIRKKAKDYIDIILFNQEKYYFHYDDIVDLFDDIIVSLPENTTNERLPGCCCTTKYCTSRVKTKKRKRDRNYYHEYQPKKQKIIVMNGNVDKINTVNVTDHKTLLPPPPPLLQPINYSNENHDVYVGNNDNKKDNDDERNEKTTVPSPPVFDGFIIDDNVNEDNI